MAVVVGVVLRMIGPRREQASTSFLESQMPSTLLEAFFGAGTQAGKAVTFETAIRLSAVYACWRLLSDTVGSMPLCVYSEDADGMKTRARESWQWRLLHDRPNREDSAIDVWGDVTGHLNEDGNAFLGKEFDVVRQQPRVVGLWPVHPQRVDIGRAKDGRKLYWLKNAMGVREKTPYTDAELIHIRGLARKGIRGLSPLSAAREAIGAGLALDEYMNRFWPNSAIPSGVLESDKELSQPAIDRLRKRWQDNYGGSRNRGRVAVLEEGLKFHAISISQRDAQFIEQHNVSVAQIARYFRVPLSLIAAETSGSSLTYRTVESDNLHFLTHSVRPWNVRIEQALAADADLFGEGESLEPEFLADALLRTDILTRYRAHEIATGKKAWARPSEVRRVENLPPDDAIDEDAKAQPPAPPAAEPEADREREGEEEPRGR